jgi:hypothetical protein
MVPVVLDGAICTESQVFLRYLKSHMDKQENSICVENITQVAPAGKKVLLGPVIGRVKGGNIIIHCYTLVQRVTQLLTQRQRHVIVLWSFGLNPVSKLEHQTLHIDSIDTLPLSFFQFYHILSLCSPRVLPIVLIVFLPIFSLLYPYCTPFFLPVFSILFSLYQQPKVKSCEGSAL